MADRWAATSSNVTIFRKYDLSNIVSKRHKTAKFVVIANKTLHNVPPEYENSVNINYVWF